MDPRCQYKRIDISGTGLAPGYAGRSTRARLDRPGRDPSRRQGVRRILARSCNSRDLASIRGTMIPRLTAVLIILGGTAWVLMPPAEDPAIEAGAPVIRMAPEITWTPERPGEGRLFVVRVTASLHTPIMGIRGDVAGEELHFERTSDRTFESLAVIPVGAEDAWMIVLWLSRMRSTTCTSCISTSTLAMLTWCISRSNAAALPHMIGPPRSL